MTETNYTVTLYGLFLGEQDSVTGHYRRGFTEHTITCAIFPEGGIFNFGQLGMHNVNDAVGFTEYTVDEGDVIRDSFDRYYQIKTLKKWTQGNRFQFYELGIEELAAPLYLGGFFGFEDDEHIIIGCEFEDGFERGRWEL